MEKAMRSLICQPGVPLLLQSRTNLSTVHDILCDVAYYKRSHLIGLCKESVELFGKHATDSQKDERKDLIVNIAKNHDPVGAALDTLRDKQAESTRVESAKYWRTQWEFNESVTNARLECALRSYQNEFSAALGRLLSVHVPITTISNYKGPEEVGRLDTGYFGQPDFILHSQEGPTLLTIEAKIDAKYRIGQHFHYINLHDALQQSFLPDDTRHIHLLLRPVRAKSAVNGAGRQDWWKAEVEDETLLLEVASKIGFDPARSVAAYAKMAKRSWTPEQVDAIVQRIIATNISCYETTYLALYAALPDGTAAKHALERLLLATERITSWTAG
jgi:hypothetical protein